MVSANIEIINQLGLHARAAAKLVSTATRFNAQIRLIKGEKAVDGKSIMSVMMLAASCGTTITIQADGPDEDAALADLTTLVNDRFGEAQ